MTVIAEVYASAPAGSTVIPAIQIIVDGVVVHRLCADFQDQMLGVDGVPQLFTAGALAISLPAKNGSGQQTLRFGMGGVNGEAQMLVDQALENDQEVILEYREYLEEDKLEPAKRPIVMTVAGGGFEGVEATFEGSYYDMLNAAWSRERYTQETAPGVQYL